MIATFLGGTVFLGLLFEKYGGNVPDLVLVTIALIVICLFLYLILTSGPVKNSRHLIYSRPKMALAILITVGAVVGGSFGALLWWGLRRQSMAAQSEPAAPQEVKVEEPKPNILPVGYRKLNIAFNPDTKTFTEADTGIPTIVALFSNETERGKVISEAKDIRARIIYEPSEYYEKLAKGMKDAEKSTTGFASVLEGIWLNEQGAILTFKRGETKTLILAVQMQDGGFGGFDAFEHSIVTRGSKEVYLPKIPKLTADKYVVKVVLTGGERGDIRELYHFTLMLRPEFTITRG